MATDIRINPTSDPFNSDATAAGEYKRIQTAGYSGSYSNYTAPASANYPANTPGRYFLFLRFTPYTGDYVTYPMLVKDVTTSTTLTRVTSAPGVNQYRVSPSTVEPAVIELHSGQAGHTIALDYYAKSSIVDAAAWNDPSFKTLAVDGAASVGGDATITGALGITGITTASTINAETIRATVSIRSEDFWSAGINRTTVPSNNADQIGIGGVYYLQGATTSNLPDSTNRFILISHYYDSTAKFQMAIRVDNAAMYVRSNAGSSWTAWSLK